MSRIRSTKPEFWASEQIMNLSREARLLFIGLWNFCDDRGVHQASTKTLKAEVFPADDLAADDVASLIAEMVKQGLVAEFEAKGKRYWHVTGWARHQRIDRPTYRHPAPPDTTTAQREIDEPSTNAQREIDEPSTPEGKGEETKGRDIPTSSGASAPLPPPPITTDPRKRLFDLGISILTQAGESEKTARAFLAKYARQDEAKLGEVLGHLAANSKVEPKSYIAAAFKPKARELVL